MSKAESQEKALNPHWEFAYMGGGNGPQSQAKHQSQVLYSGLVAS